MPNNKRQTKGRDDDFIRGAASTSQDRLKLYPHAPGDYEPSPLPIAPRLTIKQREAMRKYFENVPAHRFFAECWVYLGRELRFVPRHRDFQGIAELLEIAKLRGLTIAFESAYDRVEVEIWSDVDAVIESCVTPPWERGTGRRSGKRGNRISYPIEMWRSARDTSARAGEWS